MVPSFEDYFAFKVRCTIAFLDMMIPRWKECKSSLSSQYELKVQPQRLARLKVGKLTEQDKSEFKQSYEWDCRCHEMRQRQGMPPHPFFVLMAQSLTPDSSPTLAASTLD